MDSEYKQHCIECSVQFLGSGPRSKWCSEECKRQYTARPNHKCRVLECQRPVKQSKLCSKHSNIWFKTKTLPEQDDTIWHCEVCEREIFVPGEGRRGKSKFCSRECKNLKKRAAQYGISAGQLKAMLNDANNKCKICLKERELFLDHCHITDNIRDLICHHCNTALGMIMDDIETARRLLAYLMIYSPEATMLRAVNSKGFEFVWPKQSDYVEVYHEDSDHNDQPVSVLWAGDLRYDQSALNKLASEESSWPPAVNG